MWYEGGGQGGKWKRKYTADLRFHLYLPKIRISQRKTSRTGYGRHYFSKWVPGMRRKLWENGFGKTGENSQLFKGGLFRRSKCVKALKRGDGEEAGEDIDHGFRWRRKHFKLLRERLCLIRIKSGYLMEPLEKYFAPWISSTAPDLSTPVRKNPNFRFSTNFKFR